ncbi:sulfurtransferase complex subunit TusB [Marinobacterium sp. D7]|uniref:sulfurtransferase complex subunit TusB n=1 Tax=Marinobacterium ramblicola TaxID=2849041 RepID=UPI001C2D44BC|nr:sulfurtransferase complex subunit TusB [Marinobacterium ramblicola]MBV1789910.1 sulfurtransferase complex subunit TusB [Marinobacterium ramblicola]
MVLHTLNQAPANAACMASALNTITSEDTLLLIEDGVYWTLPAFASQLANLTGRLVALEADLKARDLKADAVESVDDAGFVALCVSHDKVVSWF